MARAWPPIPPEWRGETVFVIGGGPSFGALDPQRLRDRKVVVINHSWVAVPFAGALYFGDDRYWRRFRHDLLAGFPGRIITTCSSAHDGRVVRLRNSMTRRGHGKPRPPMLLSADPSSVPMRRTSLVPAINIAAHLVGFRGRIVLMGADGKQANGRSHHHKPHPWPVRPGCWDVQRRDLAEFAPQLKERGVEVLNASPGSAWNIWPIISHEEALSL